MINITILGSTGSIGTQTLDVVRESNLLKVLALSCDKNIDLVYKQILEFKPRYVVVTDEKSYIKLKSILKEENINIELLYGLEGLKYIASMPEVSVVVSALVGNIGLIPTIEAIKTQKRIALANKEVLVTSGEIIKDMVKKYNSELIPVDSEHSAIFQSLLGNKISEVEKLILTASGGPFRLNSYDEIKTFKYDRALKHPNWNMGRKISIDSATLMNKGLEVIEARWLFDIEAKNIDVVVHPESIIHSMVQYKDSSVIAQLGLPSMKLPIQYALFYPNRVFNKHKRLDLTEISKLTFEKPDISRFPALKLAYEALELGGIMPTILNASNEILVNLYLEDKIGFYDIPLNIEYFLGKFNNILKPSIDEILNIDREVRIKVKKEYKKYEV